MNRWIRVAALATAWCLAALYLAEQITIAPNHVDEAYLLECVRLVAHGQRIFWDFIDAYGPLNYPGPALFYTLFGDQAWGVRVWLLLVKLSCLAIAYPMMSRLVGRFSAWLTVAWLTILLGLPWQALQIPFAFLHCLPLLLASYALLILEPFERSEQNWILAGVLTAMALLIKVSSGAFLLAGGAFYCAYWWPGQRTARHDAAAASATGRAFELLGLLAYAAVFVCFVRKKVDWLFYLYLDVPLLVVLAWTALHVLGERRRAPLGVRLRAALIYTGSSALFTALACLDCFGWRGTIRYVREMSTLFSVLIYEHPVLPLGKPGPYRGFNEYYWMQLPWALTLLFVVWAIASSGGRGARVYEQSWARERARASGLFACATFGMFVFYQFGTEVHLVSAVLGAGPCLFVLLDQLRRLLEHAISRRGQLRSAWALRAALAAGVGLWLSTLAYWPDLRTFRAWPKGDWTASPQAGRSDSRLAHLRFREWRAAGVENASQTLSDPDWDQAMNRAAMFVDEITADGEEVLVASQDEIVPFHSFTRYAGGRYRAAFFWLRIGVLDRKGFDRLVPASVVRDLVDHPPRVIVSAYGTTPVLFQKIPELKALAPQYHVARAFAYILILTRADRPIATVP